MQTAQAEFICFQDTVPRVWLFETAPGQLEWLTPDVANQRGLQPLIVPSERIVDMRQRFPNLWYCAPSYYGEMRPTPPPLTPQPEPQTQTQPEPEPMPTEDKESRRSPLQGLRERVAAARKQATEGGEKSSPLPNAVVGSLRPWITAVYILLLLGVVAVCLWNILPYQIFVEGLMSRFNLTQIGQFFTNNPAAVWIAAAVIGGAAWKLSDEWLAGALFAFIVLALGFSNLYSWIIAAILWAVIQAIELLPIVMSNNPGYLRSVLREQESHQKLRISDNDDGLIRSIKKAYNALPLRFLMAARRLRLWVYLLDLMICIAVYPPVREGGIVRFIFLLTTMQWGQFDWGNIFLLFATLLAVEAVFKVLLIARNFLTYLKTSESKAPKGAIA